MGNHHASVADRHAASHDLSNWLVVRHSFDDGTLFQRCGIQRGHGRRRSSSLERNQQRVFRHSVGGKEGFALESGWRKRCGKPLDRVRCDRLRPATRHLPLAKIQSCPFLWRCGLHATAIGKVWRAAMRDRIALNSFEPSQGAFEERERRHEIRRTPDPRRLNDALHQSVIMKMGHPGQSHGSGIVTTRIGDTPALRGHIPMADHHPFRCRGRAGRILQICEVCGQLL